MTMIFLSYIEIYFFLNKKSDSRNKMITLVFCKNYFSLTGQTIIFISDAS